MAPRVRRLGNALIDTTGAVPGQGILIRSPSGRGFAEEAPGAFKDVEAVELASERAEFAWRVCAFSSALEAGCSEAARALISINARPGDLSEIRFAIGRKAYADH